MGRRGGGGIYSEYTNSRKWDPNCNSRKWDPQEMGPNYNSPIPISPIPITQLLAEYADNRAGVTANPGNAIE